MTDNRKRRSRKPRGSKEAPEMNQCNQPFVENPSPDSIEAFEMLGLSHESALGAARAGFEMPTEVQRKVIPAVALGHDVVACSETGSGKTASFVLPILDIIDYDSPHIQVVVLVPTRELCPQVAGEFRRLGANQGVIVVEVYGGMSYGGQRKQLASNPQVLVGAPGRVLDLLRSKSMDVGNAKVLILDEADRMLDMGFLPQMTEILKYIPSERQNLMFSATIPSGVSRFARLCLNDPKDISIGERAHPPSAVKQEALSLSMGEKNQKLIETIENEPGTVLVFTSTKARADDVHRLLRKRNFDVCVIHSDLAQNERKRAIEGFMSGRYRIMVATDVAQRGLDIEGIALVVNYDMPNNAEDYVHRIGRTGRASVPGRALSFVTVHDINTLRSIEKVTGNKFENFMPYGSRHSRQSIHRR